MHLIEMNNLYKTYHVGEIDVPVLPGVTLRVDRGELVALTGASGSGKTTLMNILGCLDRPTSGEYFLDGQECSKLDNDQRAMVCAIARSALCFRALTFCREPPRCTR